MFEKFLKLALSILYIYLLYLLFLFICFKQNPDSQWISIQTAADDSKFKLDTKEGITDFYQNSHSNPLFDQNLSSTLYNLGVASQRSFGIFFHSISNYLVGRAYGKMTILRSDGYVKHFYFAGNLVYQAEVRFWKDETKSDLFQTMVYFNYMCMNALGPYVDFVKEASKIDSDGVYFVPLGREEPKIPIKFSENYTNVWTKSQNRLKNEHGLGGNIKNYNKDPKLLISGLTGSDWSNTFVDYQKNSHLTENQTSLFDFLTYALHSYFGGVFIGASPYYETGFFNGNVFILFKDGTSKSMDFINAPFYRVTSNFLLATGEIYITDVYLFQNCFNPIISKKNSMDNNYTSGGQSYKVITDEIYNKLFEEARRRLSETRSNEISNQQSKINEKARQNIRSDEKDFHKKAKMGNENFITESINRNNSAEVESGLNVASQRAFQNLFVQIIRYRKGIAYGKMEVLQPDGTTQIMVFEGRTAKYEEIDSKGNRKLKTITNTHIYEGLARFRINQTSTETEDILVYYHQSCFNPMRYSMEVHGNVVFIPDEEPNKKVNITSQNADIYNNIFDISVENLIQEHFTFLDLMFVVDTTNSMGTYIQGVIDTIQHIIKEIALKYKKKVLFGFVAYRDYGEEEYLTKKQILTDDANILDFVANITAAGGHDHPEAVLEGLRDGLNITWRKNSHRYLIHVADAPPHGYLYTDNDRDGFESKVTVEEVANIMKEFSVEYKLLKCGNDLENMPKVFKRRLPSYEEMSLEGNYEKIKKYMMEVLERDIFK